MTASELLIVRGYAWHSTRGLIHAAAFAKGMREVPAARTRIRLALVSDECIRAHYTKPYPISQSVLGLLEPHGRCRHYRWMPDND